MIRTWPGTGVTGSEAVKGRLASRMPAASRPVQAVTVVGPYLGANPGVEVDARPVRIHGEGDRPCRRGQLERRHDVDDRGGLRHGIHDPVHAAGPCHGGPVCSDAGAPRRAIGADTAPLSGSGPAMLTCPPNPTAGVQVADVFDRVAWRSRVTEAGRTGGGVPMVTWAAATTFEFSESVAVTKKVPATFPAVKSPCGVIVPPVADQMTVVAGTGWPSIVAVKAWVAPGCRVTWAGAMASTLSGS